MRRLIPTVLVATIFLASAKPAGCISQQSANKPSTSHTRSALAQQNLPLIGTWQLVKSGDPPSVMRLAFNRNGTYRGSFSIGGGSNITSPPAYWEWSGIYKFTGPSSFAYTPVMGKHCVGGLCYNCPPTRNEPFPLNACQSVQSIAGQLGKQQAGSFQMNGPNQVLIGTETWSRIP